MKLTHAMGRLGPSARVKPNKLRPDMFMDRIDRAVHTSQTQWSQIKLEAATCYYHQVNLATTSAYPSHHNATSDARFARLLFLSLHLLYQHHEPQDIKSAPFRMCHVLIASFGCNFSTARYDTSIGDVIDHSRHDPFIKHYMSTYKRNKTRHLSFFPTHATPHQQRLLAPSVRWLVQRQPNVDEGIRCPGQLSASGYSPNPGSVAGKSLLCSSYLTNVFFCVFKDSKNA